MRRWRDDDHRLYLRQRQHTKAGLRKFVLTLIENKTGRIARVATRNEVSKHTQEAKIIQYRKKGVLASKIDADFFDPAVDFILDE